jgi:hypothetical protein
MVWLGSPTDPIDAVRDALEQPIAGETRERARAHAGLLRLLARAKTPLILSDSEESLERTSHTAKYTKNELLCSMPCNRLLQHSPLPGYFAVCHLDFLVYTSRICV